MNKRDKEKDGEDDDKEIKNNLGDKKGKIVKGVKRDNSYKERDKIYKG